MIVVRVELHSAITGKVTELARAHIFNIGGTDSLGETEREGRTAMAENTPMTLIERLRNPAFVTNPNGDDALLDVRQTRATMEEAADTLGALMAIIKMAAVDRT